jgi:hypothetical protein
MPLHDSRQRRKYSPIVLSPAVSSSRSHHGQRQKGEPSSLLTTNKENPFRARRPDAKVSLTGFAAKPAADGRGADDAI